MSDADHSIFGISDRRWALFASFITVVGIGLAIFTAGWAIYEYRQEQEARRVEYTLSVIDSWEEHGYRMAYGKLREEYAAFAEGLSDAEVKLAAKNPNIRANIVRNFARRIEGRAEIASNVRDVMYFFNRLGLCIDAGICSVRTAEHFFDDTISTFLQVYGPYIEPHMSDFPGGAQTVFDLSATLNAQAK